MARFPDIAPDLVRRARYNDQQAIDEIVKKTYKIAYVNAHYFLGGKADTEDKAIEITQDAYVKAFASLNKSLKNDDGFSPWFYTILNNKCIDYTRTSEYKKREISYEQFNDADRNESFIDSVENDNESFDPTTVSNKAEVREGLLNCIQNLPDGQRQAILLYYFGELKIPEICEELDEKPSTVKTWLSRGRSNIESMIQTLRAQNKSFYNVLPIPALIWALEEAVKRAPSFDLADAASKFVVTIDAKDLYAPKQFVSQNPPGAEHATVKKTFHEFKTDNGASHTNLSANNANTSTQAQQTQVQQPTQPQPQTNPQPEPKSEVKPEPKSEPEPVHEEPKHQEPPKPPKKDPKPKGPKPSFKGAPAATTAATAGAVSSSSGIIIVIVSFLIGFVLIGGIIAYTTFSSSDYKDYSEGYGNSSETSDNSSGDSSSYSAGLYTFNEDLTVYNTASKDSPTGKTVFLAGSGGNRIIITSVETNGTSSYGKIDGGYVCINDGTEHLAYSEETPVYAGAYYDSENSGEEFKNACGANYTPVQGLGGIPAENVYFRYCPLCDGTLVWY